MRALILSCNTGEGHNSCAKAIKEVYDQNGVVCDIVDGLAFVSELASDFISKGHAFVYRNIPGLFSWGYSNAEKHPDALSEDSTVYHLFSLGVERLYRYICEKNYDTVICVHVFTALIATALQRRYSLPIKTAFVATDYTCSPGTKESMLDVYFIPDTGLTGDFLCDSIPQGKVIASGIPVRQMFYQKAENPKERIGIPADAGHMVMMGGSMGCGPMDDLIEGIGKRLKSNQILTVICGTNDTLRQKLEKKCRDNRNIRIEGFVKDMSVMLDSADLYLTKPGGLSTTEAVVKEVPMVLIDAVAGCEKYNLEWFLRSGAAVSGKVGDDLAEIAVGLLKDKARLDKMRNAYTSFPHGNAAQTIFDTLNNLYK